MTNIDELLPALNTAVRRERFNAEIKLATYALINSFLVQQQIINEYLGLRSVHSTVFLTVGAATIQRFVRKPTLDPKYRGVTPLPLDAQGSISRRAIASATGLPRETVRRIVGDLLASGHIRVVGRNNVASRVSEYVPEENQRKIEKLAIEVSHLVNELGKLGVIVPR